MTKGFLSDLTITKVYSTIHLHTSEGSSSTRRNRQRWSVIFKHEGETAYINKGQKITSDIHNIIILPKGCSYNWKCIKEGRFYAIEFDAFSESDEIIQIKITNPDSILKIFEFLEKHNSDTLGKFKGIYELLFQLQKSIASGYHPSAKQTLIKPSVDYIHENFTKDLSNDFLAELSSISTVYFRKIFTELFSTSPISYLHMLRIKKAKELLKSDFGSISEIAEATGYKNIYHFSKMFKLKVGISPLEYAKKH